MRFLVFTTMAVLLSAPAAFAAGASPARMAAAPPPAPSSSAAPLRLAVGFDGSQQPLGIRYRLSDRFAIDVGVGGGDDRQNTDRPGSGEERNASTSVALSLPLTLGRWDRAAFYVRPGVLRSHYVRKLGDEANYEQRRVSAVGAFEVEVHLVPRVSVSASSGVAYSWTTLPALGTSPRSREIGWSSFGFSSADLGVHVYVW